MTQTTADIQKQVDRLFARFERMSDAELMMLRTVWDTQDEDARQSAWTMVKAELRSSRRDGMLNDARDRMAAWVNNYSYRLAFPDTLGPLETSGMDQGSIRKAAFPPMLDAIAATITMDGLDESDASVLLEPLAALSQGPSA